jgi:Spy/CpxP family protein refolding chaperone
MRTLKWALALVVPALVGVAAAQPPARHVPEGIVVQLLLLRQKSVQEELRLTPEQVRKVSEFTNKQHEAAREAIKLGEAERERKFVQLENEDRQFLADTLAPGQRKRLEQISMQLTGLMHLTRPEVARALNLTEDQVQKFRQMQKEARKELVDIFSDKNREERHERIAKLREETRRKIRAVLTDEQKAKVDELVGPQFKGRIVIEEGEGRAKE